MSVLSELGGFVCALSGLVGLVSVSLVLMRQRSGVPFSFSLNDGQRVHLSLPPAVLEIPPLSLVTRGDWVRVDLYAVGGILEET